MESALDKYLREHATALPESLDWIVRQTNVKTNYPRMLSGSVQGRLLSMLVKLTGARKILEIGTFTGYSSACLALGLPEDGHIDTLEINDELEDIISEGWKRVGVEDKITLHIGDAKETLSNIIDSISSDSELYDMAFMDANKREYCEYYESLIRLVRPGGLIVADDVLWDGKVYQDIVPSDKQTSGIVKFNDMVASDPRVESVILPLRDGLTLIRKI